MDSQSITGKTKRRGFNLIEAAIVLGVVGAVIGTIWVMAAAMMESYKVNKTVEGLFFAIRNAQKTLSSREIMNLSSTTLNSFAINSKIFPENWVKGDIISPPIGGNIYFKVNTAHATSGNFGIDMFHAASKSECMKLLVKLSSVKQGGINHSATMKNAMNIALIITDDSAGQPYHFSRYAYDFPISTQDAETACDTGEPIVSRIGISFGPTRIN